MNDYIPSGLGWPRRESAAMLVKGYAAGRATHVSAVDAGCSLIIPNSTRRAIRVLAKRYLNHYKQIYTNFILHHGTSHQPAEEILEDITQIPDDKERSTINEYMDSEREITNPPSIGQGLKIRIETFQGLHQEDYLHFYNTHNMLRRKLNLSNKTNLS